MAFLSLLPFQQIHIFLTFALRDFQRRHSLFNGQPHRFHEVFDRPALSSVTCSPWAIVVLSSTILTFFRFILPQLCQRVHFFFEKSCVWRIHERDMEVQ